MLQVELQRLESERLLQAGHADRAMIELKRLLGLRADGPLQVRETQQLVQRERTLPPSTSESAARIGARPDVQEAGARVRVTEARIDRARRDGRFDVSLFGMYVRMDAGFPQRGFNDQGNLERVRGLFHYLAAGAMVSVPLRNRNQGEIATARRRNELAQWPDSRRHN